MKAEELRIGNLMADAHGLLCKVVEIQEDGYKTQPINPLQQIPVFQSGDSIKPRVPIPLTEEWLIKFGFERNEDDYYQKESESGDWVFLEELFGSWCVSVPYIWIETVPEERRKEAGLFAESKYVYNMVNGDGGFDTVHSLQNLYFALTGEELTITEKESTL